MSRISPRAKLLLRWSLRLIGLGLFAWIISRVDVESMGERLSTADPWLALWAVLVTVFVLAVKAWRWKLLLKSLGIEVEYREVLRLYALGWYGGAISPGQLGEFFRIIPLIRRGHPAQDAFLSSLLDRLLDLAMLVLLGLVALYVLLGVPLYWPLGIVLAALASAIAMVVWMRTRGAPLFLERWATRALSRLGEDNAERFRAHLANLIKRPWSVLTVPALLSVLAAAIIALRAVLMGWSLGIDVAWYYLFLAGAGASLMAIVPISIQGIGTRDAAMILLLGAVGVEPEAALSFSLFFLALMLMHGLIGWLTWTFTTDKKAPASPTNG
ncbi:MAG: lysylphosphatidylglycerol synthase transmembrane domain-containing protein [Candidatus Alcyoniella australis]|nr:lysylphosphatidylglycerol synthase transmembrane domain-containing protein [Candidatus Alcyoniella australis]